MSRIRADRARIAAAAAVAALIVVALATPLLFQETFYFRDLSQNHGPILACARDLALQGHSLGWNPYQAGGEPLLANPNHLLLVPAGWIAILWPWGGGLAVSLIFGALLAGVGLVLLLMDCGRSPWSAATGALAYSLSGFAMSMTTLPNVLAAASWIPIALLLLRKSRRRPGWLPAAVVAAAFVFAPCEPVSALVLVVFAFLPPVARWGRTDGQSSPPGGPGWISRIGSGWRLTGIALALGLGAAACQVLPAALWVRASARGAGLSAGELTKWSLSAFRLPEIVAPGFLGDPSKIAEWWGAPRFETGWPLFLSLHIGAPVLLLALWASACRLFGLPGSRTGSQGTVEFSSASPRWVERAAVPIAGVVFLALAFGLLGPWLLWIPGASLFRYPEKFVLGAMLALIFEACAGFDMLIADLAARRSSTGAEAAAAMGRVRALKLGALGLALGLLLAGGAARPGIVSRWFALGQTGAPLSVAAAGGVPLALGLGSISAFALLALLLLPAAVAESQESQRSQGVPGQGGGRMRWLLCAAILVGTALGGVMPRGSAPYFRLRANPSAPAALFETPPFFAPALGRAADQGQRVLRFEMPPGLALRSRTGTMADLFAWQRRSLERASASEFRIALAFDRTTERLDPRGSDEAQTFFASRPVPEQVRFWSLAGVALVLAYEPLDPGGLVLRDQIDSESRPGLRLYENPEVLPRARMVHDVVRVASDRAAFEAIATAPEEVWTRRVWIVSGAEGRDLPPPVFRPPRPEAPAPTRPQAHPGDPARALPERRADIEDLATGRVRVGIGESTARSDNGPASDWLILAESDVPGWSATLDGSPVRLERANGMHLALAIPDERAHVAELHYRAPGLRAGGVISLFAILAACAVALHRSRGVSRMRGAPPASGASDVGEVGKISAQTPVLAGRGTSESENPCGSLA